MGWAKKKSNTSIPKLTAVQVQTSAKNVAMGRGWGTFRANCNLLWYGGFTATAVKTKTGGKGLGGGSQVTGYDYKADVVLGIVSGPITGIRKVWIDKAVFEQGTSPLSFTTGDFGQAVWGYLTTNYPSEAIAYSGIAYAYASAYALGQSASLANHAFEVQSATRAVVSSVTIDDADPKDIVTDLLENVYHGVPSWPSGAIASLTTYSNYCFANGLFLSPYLDAQRSAADLLKEIAEATNSGVVYSAGQVKIVPYGDTAVTGNGVTYTPDLTPIYDLTADDFQWVDGDDPLKIDLKRPAEAWNYCQIGYLDRSRDYAEDVMPAYDLADIEAHGQRKEDVKSFHSICTAETAKRVAQIRVQRACYIRRTFKFSLDWRYCLLEPMDLVTVTYVGGGLNINRQLVRITVIDEDDDGDGFNVEAEEVIVGTSAAPLYGAQAGAGFIPAYNVDPGSVYQNKLLYAMDMSNAAWSKGNATILASQTDPLGGTNAQKIQEDNTNNAHYSQEDLTTCVSGRGYTFITELKQDERTYARVLIYSLTSFKYYGVIVHLTDGSVSTTSSGPLANTSYSVTASTDGYWRIAVSADADGTDMRFGINVYQSSGTGVYTGTTGYGIYAYGSRVIEGPDPGDTTAVPTASTGVAPYVFVPPPALTPGGTEVWAVASGGPNWGGCDVYLSFDDINYSFMGTITEKARYGYLTASLASHADPDSTNTLSVDLSVSNGALGDAAHADADAGGTPSLIMGEVVNYGAVSLTGANKYDLTYLRRGSLNTNIGAHAAADPFVRLDDAVFKIPYFAPQAGQTVYIKFCSFNVYGQQTQDLATAATYSIVPVPVGSAPPASTAWSAVGTGFSNGGITVPAIVVTGANDNPSASGVGILYRLTGTATWVSTGWHPTSITRFEITSVTTSTSYDVGVQYLVNGVPGEIYTVGTVTVAGQTGWTPSTAVGTVLLSDSVAGVGKTFTLPSGSYSTVTIELVANGGDGAMDLSVWPWLEYGAGGGGRAYKTGVAVTPGSSVCTYTLRANGSGSSSTASLGSASLTANPGTSASPGTPGTGGTASGGTTNTSGTSGTSGDISIPGIGGGAGTYANQYLAGSPGTTPGGGGNGGEPIYPFDTYTPAPGAGARLIITVES